MDMRLSVYPQDVSPPFIMLKMPVKSSVTALYTKIEWEDKHMRCRTSWRKRELG